MFSRGMIFGDTPLPDGANLLEQGRTLARDWTVGPSAFLAHYGCDSELSYKQAAMAQGRVMQHAQIGWRDAGKSRRGYHAIWAECEKAGVRLDRYGLCLDWSMALPRAIRAKGQRGTGMILPDVEDFVALANAAPVAAHFGDFVLGFPAAVENTQAALTAGATTIGNLGQYFTFRVPGHDDDLEATRATVVALGLIAAQPVPVMVHSNIDDGFAAQFTDVANALGMILVERDIVTRLVGAQIGHAYGHHFSDPLVRLAFQRALAQVGAAPGTMIYGNTTSYRGGPAQNWAALGSYLMVDTLGQMTRPTGHAINPVPVTENDRIPDIEEVVDAQLFAGRLIEQAAQWPRLMDGAAIDAMAGTLLAGAQAFRAALWQGLEDSGIKTSCVFEVLLALRRIGGRRLEAAFGAGPADVSAPGGRRPVVPATILTEISEMAETALSAADPALCARIATADLRVLVATTDVHEHGKMLIDAMLRHIGATALDGGVSTEPDRLVEMAVRMQPDAIALSTYNGVALGYYRALRDALAAAGITVPILIGGRLNQIPEGSNTGLPQDVGDTLAAEGAQVCRAAADLVPVLARLANDRAETDPACP
jgi:methylmalonyl-CoA mutase cobalamin-binding subunit